MNKRAPIDQRQLTAMGLVVFAVLLGHAWQDVAAPGLVAAFAVALRVAWPSLFDGRTRIALIAVMTLAGLAVLVAQGLEDGYSAMGVRVLAVFAGLKLLESRNQRDLYIVAFVSLFLLATLFLVNQTIAAGIFGLAVTVALIAILVDASSDRAGGGFRMALGRTGGMIVLALPITLVMFVVFPRLGGPLWHFGLGEGGGVTGLSDRMTLGGISQLVQSDDIAFRAVFDDELPAHAQRYWRGPVLWRTDGRNWRRWPGAQRAETVDAGEPGLSYDLVLEPHGQPWVLPLDAPRQAPIGTRLNEDLELTDSPVVERKTYRLTWYPDAAVTALSERQREAGLQLPGDLSPRIRRLAESWQSRGKGDLGVVNAALEHFGQAPFGYTLRPPPLGRDPLDTFLFETRSGFCEHYAAAFVVLMRAAGIPARVVTGYLGGEVNPHNQNIVVRQADAHAWAEVWTPTTGWLRVDPTAAVAPERVEQGLDVEAALQAGGTPVFGSAGWGSMRRLLRQAAWLWDAVETSWYSKVVNFDEQRQQQLWRNWGFDALGESARYGIIGLVIAASIGITLWLGVSWRRTRGSALQKAYGRFVARLTRLGLGRQPSEGARDFAERISARLPDALAKQARTITTLYLNGRYGKASADTAARAIRRELRSFRP